MPFLFILHLRSTTARINNQSHKIKEPSLAQSSSMKQKHTHCLRDSTKTTNPHPSFLPFFRKNKFQNERANTHKNYTHNIPFPTTAMATGFQPFNCNASTIEWKEDFMLENMITWLVEVWGQNWRSYAVARLRFLENSKKNKRYPILGLYSFNSLLVITRN